MHKRNCLAALAVACALVVGGLACEAQAKDRKGDLLKRADIVAKKTAKLRGLAIKRPIKRGVMDKPELKARLLKRINQEYSPAELLLEELLLKRMGFLKEKDRYLDMVVNLLSDQIAGFYDPWEKQLYIASFQSMGGDMLMAHEIDHALQDQHFDLRKFMKLGKHENDAVLARQALVEGDGTAFMVEYMFADMKRGAPWGDPSVVATMKAQLGSAVGGPGMKKAPLFLPEGLFFPYIGGLAFVAHFRRSSPWKRIDKMFSKPPLSTEHILHPRKYTSYEKPVAIRAATPSALSGMKLLNHNVTGEFSLALWLRHLGVAKSKAERAAAGWGGDRAALFGKAGETKASNTLAIVHTVWDTEADAREFSDAMVDGLPTLAGPGAKAVSSTKVAAKTVYHSRSASGDFAVFQRRGDTVVVLMGVSNAAPAVLLDQVFAWQTRP